jgi:hypothetical protein
VVTGAVGPGDSQIDDFLASKGLANKTADIGLATPEYTPANAVLQNADDVYAKGLATPREQLLTPAESIAKAQAGANAPLSNADVIAKSQLPPSSVTDAGQGFINKTAAYDLAGTSSGAPVNYSLSGGPAGGTSSGAPVNYSLSGGPAGGANTSTSFVDEIKNFGNRAYDTAADAVKSTYQGGKDIYKEYFSPVGIRDQGIDDAVKSIQDKFPTITKDQILSAEKGTPLNQMFMDALPGPVAQYAPLVLAGTAAAYGLGAFDGKPAEKPEPPTLGSDVFAANPQDYLVNQGGVNTRYYGDIQGAQYGPQRMKTGGIADLPTKYPRKNGPINGPGTGTSDDIPAMLSDGEFVFTAKAVRNMGAGSRRLGAKRMYTMMKALEKRSA